ncbi:MAG: GrpB family protein [Candidatus Thorarchaeota archaeon]
MTREVKVVPYNNEWTKMYDLEVARLREVLGNEIVSAFHIGSTSIPGMSAKPIIDILLEVKSISKLDDYNNAMIGLGYNPRGELGIPGRRYFSKDDPSGIRSHHVHAFQSGDIGLERHLAFRDYMIVHSKDAQQYAQLKLDLAETFRWDIDGYCDGKDSFVAEMEKKALLWYRSLKNTGQ